MELLTGEEVPFDAGKHSYQVVVSSGTTTLAMSIDGGAFKQIKNASWTADDNDNMTIGHCKLKVTIGGSGTFNIVPIEESGGVSVR